MTVGRENKNFLERNNFWLGIAVGICVPIAMYGIMLWAVDLLDEFVLPPDVSVSRGFRERTLSVIAICCNLIPFHLYQKRYADNTMRGMVFPTLLYVAIWFWIFGRQIVGLG